MTTEFSKTRTLEQVAEELSRSFGAGLSGKEILAQVQRNRRMLDACLRHSFVALDETAITGSKGKPFRDYVCSACGGKVDSHAFYWYSRGLEHGRNNP